MAPTLAARAMARHGAELTEEMVDVFVRTWSELESEEAKLLEQCRSLEQYVEVSGAEVDEAAQTPAEQLVIDVDSDSNPDEVVAGLVTVNIGKAAKPRKRVEGQNPNNKKINSTSHGKLRRSTHASGSSQRWR